MGLRQAIQSLNDAVSDLTSLHVQTFTGTVNIIGNSKKPIENFDNLKDALKKATETNADVHLVAETYLKFDGDSYNFISSDTDVPSSALALHKSAVEAGLNTRRGLLGMVEDIF